MDFSLRFSDLRSRLFGFYLANLLNSHVETLKPLNYISNSPPFSNFSTTNRPRPTFFGYYKPSSTLCLYPSPTTTATMAGTNTPRRGQAHRKVCSWYTPSFSLYYPSPPSSTPAYTSKPIRNAPSPKKNSSTTLPSKL